MDSLEWHRLYLDVDTKMSDTITTAAAADMLGVTHSYVCRLLRDGRIDGERIDTLRGPVWRVSRASVERYASSPRKVGKPRREDSNDC